jgi:hypothetical protein
MDVTQAHLTRNLSVSEAMTRARHYGDVLNSPALLLLVATGSHGRPWNLGLAARKCPSWCDPHYECVGPRDKNSALASCCRDHEPRSLVDSLDELSKRPASSSTAVRRFERQSCLDEDELESRPSSAVAPLLRFEPSNHSVDGEGR